MPIYAQNSIEIVSPEQPFDRLAFAASIEITLEKGAIMNSSLTVKATKYRKTARGVEICGVEDSTCSTHIEQWAAGDIIPLIVSFFGQNDGTFTASINWRILAKDIVGMCLISFAGIAGEPSVFSTNDTDLAIKNIPEFSPLFAGAIATLGRVAAENKW